MLVDDDGVKERRQLLEKRMSKPASYTFDVFGRCSQCGMNTMNTAGTCWYCEYQKMATAPTEQPQPHTCPTCSGTGKVSRPPWLAGDINSWTDTGTRLYTCQSCMGKGILWR